MKLEGLRTREDLNCQIVSVLHNYEDLAAECAAEYGEEAVADLTAWLGVKTVDVSVAVDADEGGDKERWVVRANDQRLNVPTKSLFRLRPEK
jgi:hypothetical protein